MRLLGADGPVAELFLDTPATVNALTTDDFAAGRTLLDRAASSPSVRVLLIHGAGRGFCSGVDLRALATLREHDEQGRVAFLRDALSFVQQLTRFPRPTVAAVHGSCFGVGICLALAADRVVAAPDAAFGLVFTRLGLAAADTGALWLLARRIGPRRAWQLFAEAPVLAATAAHDLGLVDEVTDSGGADGALAAARAVADRWRANAPGALAVTKEQVLRLEGGYDDFAGAEIGAVNATLGGAEFAEGLAAAREKRTPTFP